MENKQTSGISHAVGHVRVLPPLKDGNTRFRVGKQWFLVRTDSVFTQIIRRTKKRRAIVIFEESDRKYPDILSITPDYTTEQLLMLTTLS